jgi:hypothetical protein
LKGASGVWGMAILRAAEAKGWRERGEGADGVCDDARTADNASAIGGDPENIARYESSAD